MAIDKHKKKEILLKSFEIIKDNYEKNKEALSRAVIKMFKIDVDTAIDMWCFLLTKYQSIVTSDYCWNLTEHIMYEGENAIGEIQFEDLVLNNRILKESLFSLPGGDVNLIVCGIIRRRIVKNDLQVADDLLSRLYSNKNRGFSWYELLDEVIIDDPDEMTISEEGYELLEMWCDKISDQEERAKLSIKMMEFLN